MAANITPSSNKTIRGGSDQVQVSDRLIDNSLLENIRKEEKKDLIELIKTSPDDPTLIVKLYNLMKSHGAATSEPGNKADPKPAESLVRDPGDIFAPFSRQPSPQNEPSKMADQQVCRALSSSPEPKTQTSGREKRTPENEFFANKSKNPPNKNDIDDAMRLLETTFGRRLKITISEPETDERAENLSIDKIRQKLSYTENPSIKVKSRYFAQTTYDSDEDPEWVPAERRSPSRAGRRSSLDSSQERMTTEHAREQPISRERDNKQVTSFLRDAAQVKSSQTDCQKQNPKVPIPYCQFRDDLNHGQRQGPGNYIHHTNTLGNDCIKLASNGENLQEWEQQLEILYLKENMQFFLYDPPEKPWDCNIDCLHHKAYYVMIATISPCFFPSIPHNLTVAEIYQMLRNLLQRDNATATSRKSREFYGAKLKRGITMSEHILNLNAARAELIQRGEVIPERVFKSVLINSLDSSWEYYVTLLDSLNMGQMTLEDIKGKLIAEDKNRRERSRNYKEDSFRKWSESPYRGKPTQGCDSCGSNYHHTRDCPRDSNYKGQHKQFEKRVNFQDRQSPERKEKRGRSPSYNSKPKERDSQREDKRGYQYGLDIDEKGNRNTQSLWLIDSGATCHTTHNKEILSEFVPTNYFIRVANQRRVSVKGVGTTYIEGVGQIEGVLYVPEIPKNILASLKLTTEKQISIILQNGKMKVLKGNIPVKGVTIIDGLAYLSTKRTTDSKGDKGTIDNVSSDNCVDTQRNLSNGKMLHDNCSHLLHRRLGHANFQTVQKMYEHSEDMKVKNCNNYLDCSVCKSAKLRCKPKPKKATRTTQSTFQLIHMDLVGPLKPSLKFRKRYFLTIVDDYSRFGYVYTLNHKHETLKKVKEFYKLIEVQHGKKIKQIMTDRGSEFLSNDFINWTKEQGIKHLKSCPFSPFQNGVSERKNGLLQTMVRCVLEDADLSQSYWAEALAYSNYTLNRLWSSSINKSPYEAMYDRKPKLGHLHIFGVPADVYIPRQLRRKGEKVSKRLIFVGYETGTKGYRFVDKHNNFVISRTANFHEHGNWSKIHLNDLNQKGEHIHAEKTEHPQTSTTTNKKTKPRPNHAAISKLGWKEGHPKIHIDKLSNKEARYLHSDETPKDRTARSNRNTKPKRFQDYIMSISSDTNTPKNYREVLKLPEAERLKWEEAMNKEMQSLEQMNVYTPVSTPLEKSPIGTKWVFKIKELEDKQLLYKARLVAQGFSQQFPDDYEDTYSPTVRSESVKIAFTLAPILNLDVYQFDVQTAYLHAELDKKIYVKAPPNVNPKNDKYWLLNKSLYGLKQSGKRWYDCLSQTLIKLGFKPSSADLCFFVKGSNGSKEFVLIYVDDILYFGKERAKCDEFASELNNHFKLKILGKVNKYLGVLVEKTEKGFKLSQKDKIQELVRKCRLEQSKGADTPMAIDFVRNMYVKGKPFKENTLFRSVIGSLLYISNWTRPDITLAVNLLSRNVSSPNVYHWEAVKRVVRYLSSTIDFCLCLEPYVSGIPYLSCFADADWATNDKNRKSTSGYVFCINDSPVYWCTGKQTLIATSTAEAEYICLSNVANNLTWIDDLLIDTWTEPDYPIIVHEDNKAAIDICKTEAVGKRSRHIDIKFKHVRQMSDIGFIKLKHCETSEQVADIFTKPLPAKQHSYLSSKLGLR